LSVPYCVAAKPFLIVPTPVTSVATTPALETKLVIESREPEQMVYLFV